jgi:aspartate/methionine/tyrosine aminotransferase
VQAWGRTYDGRRGPLVDLSQAVPGYPPHPLLLERLAAAAGDRASAAYGPIEGDRALRDAFARHQSAVYGATLAAENLHVTAGCNQAFVVAALAFAEPGSRVLLTNPFYFNHETTLQMFGVGVGLVDCPATTGFLPDPATLDAAITPDVRAVAFVSPNNPTGAVYPPALIEALHAVCARRGIWMILDETYRDFLAPGAGRPHGVFGRPDWGDSFVSLYSFSKSFCIPGHRLGAVTGSPAVIEAVGKIMDNLQICAPRVGQIAVAETIDTLADWREANRAEIAARAAALRAAVEAAPGWQIGAVGAYFAFVRHPYAGTPSLAVAEKLALEAGILTLPGGCFGPGQEDFLRFAFANADVGALEEMGRRLAG